MDHDRIYIFQDAPGYEAVFVFDHQGRLLYKIQNPGEGPGSIALAGDFLVDRVGEYIEILDRMRKKIFRYDWHNGAPAGELDIPRGFRKFAKTGKDRYVFFAGNDTFGDSLPHNLYIVDFSNGQVKKHLPLPRHLHRYFIKEQNFASAVEGEEYLLKFILSDTIYRVDGDGVWPAYAIDYGGRWVREETLRRLAANNRGAARRQLLYDRKDHVFHIVTLFETKDYLFFTNFYQEKMYWNIYDKHAKQTRVAGRRENDIDHGPIGDLLYWPLNSYGDEHVIFLLPTEDILEKIDTLRRMDARDAPPAGKFDRFAGPQEALTKDVSLVVALGKLRRPVYLQQSSQQNGSG
jgi:hypothetical protein